MADLKAKIVAILRDCPLSAGMGEKEIARLSERFAAIGSAGEALSRPLATKKGVLDCLGELRGNARKLIRQFDEMPMEALAAMDLDEYGRLRLITVLLEIVWRAEDGEKKAPRLKSNQRRPPNVQAICTTLLWAQAWKEFTGKKPNRGFKDRTNAIRSDFEQVLARIFLAMDIGANAEHYARELSRGAWREIIEERLRRVAPRSNAVSAHGDNCPNKD